MQYEQTFYFEKEKKKMPFQWEAFPIKPTPSFLKESLKELPAKRLNLKHKPLKWVYNFEPIILKSSQDL